jgi:hypothetical protein
VITGSLPLKTTANLPQVSPQPTAPEIRAVLSRLGDWKNGEPLAYVRQLIESGRAALADTQDRCGDEGRKRLGLAYEDMLAQVSAEGSVRAEARAHKRRKNRSRLVHNFLRERSGADATNAPYCLARSLLNDGEITVKAHRAFVYAVDALAHQYQHAFRRLEKR